MADSTLRLTYDKLRIRVAEYLGVAYYGAAGDQAAQLPIDAHDLDRVTRLVDDGYHRFMTENDGKWNFLTVPLTLVFGTGLVAADASRLYLPDDFYGIIVGPFTYGATGPRIEITQVTGVELRRMQAASSSTGTATYFTVRPINTIATATGQRWEAVFYPAPTGTETITALYKRFPQAMANGTDSPISGYIHDRTILAACMAEAELDIGDNIGPREAAYQRELAKSKRIDLRTTAPRILDYGDKSEAKSYGRPANYYGVDTYNGNAL